MTERNQPNYVTNKDSGTLSGRSGKCCLMLPLPHWSSHWSKLYQSPRKPRCAVRLWGGVDGRRVQVPCYSQQAPSIQWHHTGYSASKPIHTMNWQSFLKAPWAQTATPRQGQESQVTGGVYEAKRLWKPRSQQSPGNKLQYWYWFYALWPNAHTNRCLQTPSD